MALLMKPFTPFPTPMKETKHEKGDSRERGFVSIAPERERCKLVRNCCSGFSA